MNASHPAKPVSAQQALRLAADPDYLALRRARRTVCWGLALLNVLVYSLYILSIAWGEQWFTLRWGDSAINLGLWFTVFIIVFSLAISGFYLYWTNNSYDPALARLCRQYGIGE